MHIVSVSMMRNEADIIEAFVRYHLQFVSRMVIVDHLSADDSRTIVRKLQDEGLPIELRTEDRLAFTQAEFVNEVARETLERYDAQWLLPLDTDEFLVPLNQTEFKAQLSYMSGKQPVLIPWRTYIPRSSDAPGPNVLRRITHRLEREVTQYYKVIVPCDLIRHKKHKISIGNHELLDHNDQVVPGHIHENIALAHYPVRSTNQIIIKTLIGWFSHLIRPNRKEGENYHKQLLFDRFIENSGFTSDDLETLAVEFLGTPEHENIPSVIHDPLPDALTEFPIQYRSAQQYDPISISLRAAEAIAREYGLLRTQLLNDKIAQWHENNY